MGGDGTVDYPVTLNRETPVESSCENQWGEFLSSLVDKETQEKIWYVILGGSPESMEKRVGAVVEEIKRNPGSKVIVTGFKSEIEKIKWFINKDTPIKNQIIEVLSYDTVSNILNTSKKINSFAWYDKLIIPTAPCHAERVKIIFEKKLPDVKLELEFPDTKEAEARYANIASWIYRVFNPSLLQYASIMLRPKTFIKEYWVPLMKEKAKTRKALFDVLSETH